MIASLALFTALQVTTLHWAALPPLPFRTPPVVTDEIRAFVNHTVREAKCPAARDTLQVDIAILLEADGDIRTIIPRAINCTPVEQYVAGLVSVYARGNLLPRLAESEQWYRVTISFPLRKK